jgi:hypothetical protein
VPLEAAPIKLTGDERDELRQITISRSLPAGDVKRGSPDSDDNRGRSYAEIEERLQTTPLTISRWKKRFLSERLHWLIPAAHPGQKPTVITQTPRASIRSHPAQTEGWFDALVGSETGTGLELNLAGCRRQAAPPGALHGQ